ncbi:YobI family P-loop NTPase [Herbiconiux solani]|uniref:YobI family P-loop NTPase n=1 Tax=Herbiconiux solani TaxID=661329 RepID=UPI0035712EDC
MRRGGRIALKLQPLTAAHDDAQHKLYSDELIDLLRDDKRRATVWNIALTGNYGSGKSSILAGEEATSGSNLAVVPE